MKLTYEWKDGARTRTSPVVAGSEFERIRKERGKLTPQAVVDESRPPTAPLHREFEWDDAKAAKQHREDQARYMLRSITVRVERDDGESVVRAYVVTTGEERELAYTPVGEALSDEDKRREVLKRALDELTAWQRKYRDLRELAEVFSAIEELDAVHLLAS